MILTTIHIPSHQVLTLLRYDLPSLKSKHLHQWQLKIRYLKLKYTKLTLITSKSNAQVRPDADRSQNSHQKPTARITHWCSLLLSHLSSTPFENHYNLRPTWWFQSELGNQRTFPPNYYYVIYSVTEAITSTNLVQKIDAILNTLMCAEIWLVHQNTDLSIIDLTVEKKAWTRGLRHDMGAHQSHAHSKLLTGAGDHTKKEHRAQQIHPKCRHPPP